MHPLTDPATPLSRHHSLWAVLATVLLTTACAEPSQLLLSQRTGKSPTLPAPQSRLLPVVHIAPAVGWPEGATPLAAPGLQVNAFASGLDHPRWVTVLPNGDVLVAESNAPQRPDDAKGLKGLAMTWVMSAAGATAPSADRITLLRDTNGDGIADQRSVFASSLSSPFGMVALGPYVYVANTDAVVRLPYSPGALRASGTPTSVVPLPAGPINHHWTKNIIASPDERFLYVTVGSNSNVAENGLEAEVGRAAIWQLELATGKFTPFASGLRNPNGMAFEPSTQALWTVVNERDELGNDLVPDYLTSVRPGAFYGWPQAYYGQHPDTRVSPPRPDLVAAAVVPDYALGSHVAPLGLAWSAPEGWPPAYASGMWVGEHGSWNRQPRSGYEVIFIPFAQGEPTGLPHTVLSGFVNQQGQAMGRPAGVAVDRRGNLFVADDVGNVVWRVSATPP